MIIHIPLWMMVATVIAAVGAGFGISYFWTEYSLTASIIYMIYLLLPILGFVFLISYETSLY